MPADVRLRTPDLDNPPPPASNHPPSPRIEWPGDRPTRKSRLVWGHPEPRSFADTFCDAFTPPDALDDGLDRSLFDLLPGPVQDALHMRLYFAIAVAAHHRSRRAGGKHGR